MTKGSRHKNGLTCAICCNQSDSVWVGDRINDTDNAQLNGSIDQDPMLYINLQQ